MEWQRVALFVLQIWILQCAVYKTQSIGCNCYPSIRVPGMNIQIAPPSPPCEACRPQYYNYSPAPYCPGCCGSTCRYNILVDTTSSGDDGSSNCDEQGDSGNDGGKDESGDGDDNGDSGSKNKESLE